MSFVDFVICYWCYGTLVTISKYGWSAQMTMPARRASKLCVKRRAALLPMLSKCYFLCNCCDDRTLARMSTWKILGVRPTVATTMMTMMMSQQPPFPTATNKQTCTGSKYPVQWIPPHSDIYIYIYILMSLSIVTWVRKTSTNIQKWVCFNVHVIYDKLTTMMS